MRVNEKTGFVMYILEKHPARVFQATKVIIEVRWKWYTEKSSYSPIMGYKKTTFEQFSNVCLPQVT